MHTVLDYLRVASAVAVGCALYDMVMLTIVRVRYAMHMRAMAKEHAAIVDRIDQLKAKAEGASKEA